jgi:repressor LexA
MNESGETVRPTKKQREILTYIEQFIGEHGYSPSYREIMNGLQYTSVATVALHVNSLIRRGHLRKRDRSARSLEVVNKPVDFAAAPATPDEHKWLVDKIVSLIIEYENSESKSDKSLADLQVLISALRILGLDGAATTCESRLASGAAAELLISDAKEVAEIRDDV